MSTVLLQHRRWQLSMPGHLGLEPVANGYVICLWCCIFGFFGQRSGRVFQTWVAIMRQYALPRALTKLRNIGIAEVPGCDVT